MTIAARYTPPTSFHPAPLALVLPFVEARALCTLVGVTSTGLHASHLPLVVERDAGAVVLRGHVARSNVAWLGADEKREALAIFAGQDDYGVPLEAQRESHALREADAYGAVHLFGRIRIVYGQDFLLANMEALSARHPAGRAHVWNTDRLEADVLERLVSHTVGIEFAVVRAEACATYADSAAGKAVRAAACERGGM